MIKGNNANGCPLDVMPYKKHSHPIKVVKFIIIMIDLTFYKREKSNELSLDKICLGFSCKEHTSPIFQSLNIL